MGTVVNFLAVLNQKSEEKNSDVENPIRLENCRAVSGGFDNTGATPRHSVVAQNGA